MTDLSAQLEEIAKRMAYSHGGTPPFLVNKDAVERIMQLHKENPGHWSQIAHSMDDEGFPTPARSPRWLPSTVKRIVLREQKKKR